MRHEVFVSYAAEDEPIARRIVEFLQGRGIRCWIDRQNLRFTGKYDREIEKAIRRSRVVLWLASSHSIASDYVKFEVGTASNCGTLIGPVYLEAMDPARLPAPFNLKLANVQGIEWFKASEQANLETLAGEVGRLVRGLRRRQAARISVIAAVVLAMATLGRWGVVALREGGGPGERQSRAAMAQPASAQRLQPDAPTSTPFPERLEGLPAAEVLKIAYTGSPPSAGATDERPAIQMAILVRRAGQSEFSVVNDGDSLASERDDYLIALRPLSGGFLYVFQVDSVGNKTWLFPRNETSEHSSGDNPVELDRVVQIPSAEANRVLFLDRNIGVEHVYAVFSAVRWPELEAALGHQAEPGEEPASARPDAPLVAAVVRSPNGLSVRGVGGTRPKMGRVPVAFTVDRTDGGESWSVPISGDPFQSSGSFLVVERWFRHGNVE